MARVTVVLPSYNHAPFLRAAIDSVLEQTFGDLELIVCDDASVDDSWQIIQSYRDPRLRAFRNERRQGMQSGLNQAITGMATGEFIAIQHSDDVWEPVKLEAQVQFLESHTQHGAVFTNAAIVDEQGRPFTDTTHFYFNVFNQPTRTRHEWLNFFFTGRNALCHPSALIRKSFFDRYGPYRHGFSQVGDYDTWVRICLHHEIFVLPEKLIQFRVRDNLANASLTPASRLAAQFEFYRVLENYLQIADRDEMLAIFPGAREHMRPEHFDPRFVLGMLAVRQEGSRHTILFGLNLLFEALNDHERAKQLRDFYGFDAILFREIKSRSEVFDCTRVVQALQLSRSRLASLQAQYDAEKAVLTELSNSRLVRLENQLHDIEQSAGWRLLMAFGRLRRLAAPPGSLAERIWRAFLHLVRLRR